MDFSNLQSRVSTAYIPPHRTQLHPRIVHSFSSPSSSPNLKQQSHHKCLILLASLFTLPFLFYLFATAHKIHHSSKFQAPKPKSFGIVIHSSPTGSRIRVFEFLNEGRIPFIGLHGSGSHSFNVRPGLLGFKEEPESAGVSISELIEFAKGQVPRSEWASTKVQLMASGELDKFGEDLRDAILQSCRRVLRASGFLFEDDWARVIEDQEQGVYAWVAANYALGTLGSEPQQTTGIVELGGTSMQVAFAPREPPPMQFLRIIKFAGVTYNLYIQSLPQFGQDAAWESLHKLQNSRNLTSFSSSSEGIPSNPCIPRGYELSSNASDTKLLTSHPSGNFSACRLEVLALLKRNQVKCLHPPCEIISSFFIELRGKPVPPESFFYTSELFGLDPKASLSEVEVAGQHYCEDDWDKLKNEHRIIDDLDLSRYCFSSAYIVALLHDNLGITLDDKRFENVEANLAKRAAIIGRVLRWLLLFSKSIFRRIGFARHTGTIPLNWMLGAFILQTMLEPQDMEADNPGRIVGNESVTYFSLFVVLLIAMVVAFFVLRWRKPQLKTIYDLEKGRYIVTRVPR